MGDDVDLAGLYLGVYFLDGIFIWRLCHAGNIIPVGSWAISTQGRSHDLLFMTNSIGAMGVSPICPFHPVPMFQLFCCTKPVQRLQPDHFSQVRGDDLQNRAMRASNIGGTVPTMGVGVRENQGIRVIKLLRRSVLKYRRGGMYRERTSKLVGRH